MSHKVLDTLHAEVRPLVMAWFSFAVAALGISTIFALMLIISRTPGLSNLLPSHDFFYHALVLHVNFSTLIWVLSAGATLLIMLSPARLLRLAWSGLGLAIIGSALLAFSPLIGNPEAFKNNYIPIINSGTFLTGLVFIATAIGLIAIRSILLIKPWLIAEKNERMIQLCAYGVAWAMGLAGISTLWVFFLTPDLLTGVEYYEQLFWAPGHILQFANVLLMMLAWLWLNQRWQLFARSSFPWVKVILILGILPLLAVPVLLLLYPPSSEHFKQAFTELMRWGTWLAALPLGLSLLWQLFVKPPQDSCATGVKISIVLFTFGILIGSLIRADNVMVPAHYHGTIGAVTLAMMVVSIVILPQLGFNVPSHPLARWQFRLYGGGTFIMALGLAISGWLGVARKLPGDMQSSVLEHSERIVGMSLAGVGGVLAVIGSALFVFNTFSILFAKSETDKPINLNKLGSQERLRLTGVLSLSSIAILLLLLYSGGKQAEQQFFTQKGSAIPNPYHDPNGHVGFAQKQQIDERFQQAIVMLHAKQYEYAIAALQDIVAIRPNIPEVHVNIGYALIGLEQYQEAVRAFDHATELNPNQLNAYYGMAIALSESGDLAGALGAMRSYVHLSPADDPFVRRASAAIWEWEELLKQAEMNSPAE